MPPRTSARAPAPAAKKAKVTPPTKAKAPAKPAAKKTAAKPKSKSPAKTRGKPKSKETVEDTEGDDDPEGEVSDHEYSEGSENKDEEDDGQIVDHHPITYKEFNTATKSLKIVIGDPKVVMVEARANAKEFSTGLVENFFSFQRCLWFCHLIRDYHPEYFGLTRSVPLAGPLRRGPYFQLETVSESVL